MRASNRCMREGDAGTRTVEMGVRPGVGPAVIDPDVALVREFKSGHAEAFDSLYHRYSTYIYNTCLGILGDPDDARDAMQNSFVQAFRSLPKFREQSRFSTWLYRIAVNKCTDLVRRRPKWDSTDSLEQFDDSGDGGDAFLEERVRQAILKLRPDYRAVLVLFYFQQMSYDEIAEALGCSNDQVRVRLHRARKAFRTLYADGGGDSEL